MNQQYTQRDFDEALANGLAELLHRKRQEKGGDLSDDEIEIVMRDYVQQFAEFRYGHLERRLCSAESPMPMADKDNYRWSHPDAIVIEPFFNLVHCACPHCGLHFNAVPREH